MNKTLTKLEKRVMRWAKRYNSENPEHALDELAQHGCQSGIVGELIYYVDTVKFYKRYMQEIDAMLVELLQDTGMSVNELFGDKWDKEDPFARDMYNQNLLAWFGFEESANRLMQDQEIDA